MANTREPILHPVPILSLRPTEMTVGMREVKEKRKRWREHKSDKKRAELLGQHMIPVVFGPDERYYVVDHHHLARALHDEGVKDVLRLRAQAQGLPGEDAWVLQQVLQQAHPRLLVQRGVVLCREAGCP